MTERTKGERMFCARDTLIRSAREKAARLTDMREEFEALARELEEAPTSMEEFIAGVRITRPEYAHTLEWDECPEDWQRECYCATCLSYMAEDA